MKPPPPSQCHPPALACRRRRADRIRRAGPELRGVCPFDLPGIGDAGVLCLSRPV